MMDEIARYNAACWKALVEAAADEVNIQAEGGTWNHFTAVIPPWFVIHAMYRPDVFF